MSAAVTGAGRYLNLIHWLAYTESYGYDTDNFDTVMQAGCVSREQISRVPQLSCEDCTCRLVDHSEAVMLEASPAPRTVVAAPEVNKVPCAEVAAEQVATWLLRDFRSKYPTELESTRVCFSALWNGTEHAHDCAVHLQLKYRNLQS